MTYEQDVGFHPGERLPALGDGKIDAFKKIVESAGSGFQLQYGAGAGGSVPGSSSYYQWVKLRRLK